MTSPEPLEICHNTLISQQIVYLMMMTSRFLHTFKSADVLLRINPYQSKVT